MKKFIVGDSIVVFEEDVVELLVLFGRDSEVRAVIQHELEEGAVSGCYGVVIQKSDSMTPEQKLCFGEEQEFLELCIEWELLSQQKPSGITESVTELVVHELRDWLFCERLLDEGCDIYYNRKVLHLTNGREPAGTVTPGYCSILKEYIIVMEFGVLKSDGAEWLDRLEVLLAQYGLGYRFLTECVLEIYTTDSSIPTERTVVQDESPVVDLYMYGPDDFGTLVPEFLKPVMKAWYAMSCRAGDTGSVVTGAGISFELKGMKYFMHACSPYMGCISWETGVDIVTALLKEGYGATNVFYRPGRMD